MIRRDFDDGDTAASLSCTNCDQVHRFMVDGTHYMDILARLWPSNPEPRFELETMLCGWLEDATWTADTRLAVGVIDAAEHARILASARSQVEARRRELTAQLGTKG